MNKTAGSIMLYLFIALWMVIVPFVAFGQGSNISGYVRDSLTGAPLYPATIFDRTSGVAAYADSAGYYSIPAKEGDQLIYSFLGYYSVSYPVPAAGKSIVHDVGMISKREQLGEVTVQALTPYQSDSAARISTFKNYMNKTDYPFLSDMSVGTGFGLSFNLDYFSKDSKRKRRFHKRFRQFERDAFVDSRYTPQRVERLTGLQGDSLTTFLYRFRPSYEFTRYTSDLEFLSWIKMKYMLWISGRQDEDRE